MIKTIELAFASEVKVNDADRALLVSLASSVTGGTVRLDTYGSNPNSLSRLTLETTAHFEVSDGAMRMLDAFCFGLCDQFNHANPTMIMWPSSQGARPNWSKQDAAFLGKSTSEDAPDDGEPTFDDSVWQIECTCREDYYGSNPWNPDKDALREAAAKERKAQTPQVVGVGRMADNDKAILVIFDKVLTDDQLRHLSVRV